jgi:hypothetical protein
MEDPVKLTDTQLLLVLPKQVRVQRRKLLPQILEEWDRTDLREHLSRESRAITRDRIRKLEIVKKCAGQLLNALADVDERGHTAIVAQMIIADGRRVLDVGQAEIVDRTTRLNQERQFLANLKGIAPENFWSFRPGQPRNVASYLVLQDAASIFEWLSGTKAARGVNRIDATEAGPFFRFASTLWPAIFGQGVVGLPAAMKNWARWRSAYQERSALIANIALRHPTWGIFER